MADFTPPFANGGERREPTTDEQDSGYGCGPAQLPLFNWLMWALQSEVGEVIDFAGLTPNNGDMTQLRQAIQALISAATGGGDTSNFVLMTQARARMPIFPEVLNVDGKIVVNTPAPGTVRVPGGVDFLHRGIFKVTTSQLDLPTDPSKTYHVRWDPTNGFTLKDLAGSTYNPTALAEINPIFDSTYDDMIVARVVTNSSNVATITNLSNKQVLTAKGYGASAPFGNAGYDPVNPSFLTDGSMDPYGIVHFATQFINFARTPEVYMTALGSIAVAGSAIEIVVGARPLSRYAVAVWAQGDHGHSTAWAARA